MVEPSFKIESGVQLLARLTKKTKDKNIYSHLFENGLQCSDTVEVISNKNTCFLLIDIICEALYPAKEKEEIVVFLFDTTGNYLQEHLIKMLHKKIFLSLDNFSDSLRSTEADKILQKVLSNFYVLQIYDASQLYITIHNLDTICMKHQNISLLLFDHLPAFYWSEQGFKITKMDLYIKNLLRMIQNVCKEYKVIIIYTRPEYFNSDSNVNYKIQVLDYSKEVYQVIVKTAESDYKKYFNIENNLIIKWHSN